MLDISVAGRLRLCSLPCTSSPLFVLHLQDRRKELAKRLCLCPLPLDPPPLAAPPLVLRITQDRRKELAKSVAKFGEDGKVALRNVRKDIMKKV